MPGASRLNVKTFLLMVFRIFRLLTTRQNCRAFWLLHLVYRLMKLTNLALIVFEWLKRIEPNVTTFCDPRIKSNQCIHGRPQKIFQWRQRRNFAYPFQVADDACTWTFTKRFTLSSSLVCGGWTSIHNLLSETFSSFQLSEMLFLFINCLISIFDHFLQTSHNSRIINGQNNMSGEKIRKLDTLAKTATSNEK